MGDSADESSELSNMTAKNKASSIEKEPSVVSNERSQRASEREKKKELQLLSLQLFTTMCDHISELTDKHNLFLDNFIKSVEDESHAVSKADVDNFLAQLEASIGNVTVTYNELCEINKDSSDKTHEKAYSEFMAGIEVLKRKLADSQAEEELILEEERKLEEAKKQLEAKLQMFQQKNKSFLDKLGSHITVVPHNQPPASSSCSTDRQVSMTSPAPSANESHISSQQGSIPDKEWLKDFTRELTHGLAESFDKRNQSKERRWKKAVEPEVFSGNPMTFNDWEIDFDSFVEAEELTEREALRHIKKYLSGKARDCVLGLLSVNTEEAYRQCRRKLKERFATEEDVSRIFRKRLREWPTIKYPDGEKLRDFADFLDHIKSSMSSVPGLDILNDRQQNEYMSQKLPENLKIKWVEVINEWRVKKRYPLFSDFADFVSQQATTYMNPIMRHSRNPPGNSTAKADNRWNDRARQTGKKTYSTLANGSNNNVRKQYCYYCKNNEHSTPNCSDLNALDYTEKMKFINQNNLCYRCTKHRGLAKDCRSQVACSICKKNHATILHNPDFKTSDKTTISASSTQNNQSEESHLPTTQGKATATANDVRKVNCTTMKRTTYNMMVPVYVSSGSIEKLVYALIDNASDSCYIDSKIAKEINATGIKEEVRMLTMNAETKETLMLYQDLTIRGYLTNNSTQLDAYESASINCNSEQIPTSDKCFKLPHLQKIASQLPPLLNIPIGLLIGGDCPQAIHYSESIAGPDGEPFAAKTMFGWTLCGGKPSDTKRISCMMTKMERNQHEVFRMVERDFHDIDGKPMSQDDLTFIQIMETETYQEEEGAYIMPLPFKAEPQLKSNRNQALQRLLQLKSKLKRDQSYREEYQNFMDNLLLHGHAEEVSTEEADKEECWYIPHFGVRHPKKKKLRIVYDGSCKYNSTSLNDCLLKGPDQLNDLLGILLRFRLGKIAITCDIEQMFYNFKVAEKHRDFIRFLWFDKDLETVKTYRMTRHIFGATSSPGVATFGLRRIATDYADMSPQASEFLIKNFYVDDGIVSVDDLKEGQDLVQGAREICAQGNLRLHKFVSNSIDILEKIPESERATQLDATSENLIGLPLQRTLGIEWCINNDTITFTSNLQQKPITKRGILSTIAQVYDPLGLVAPFTLQGKTILQDVCRQKVEWDGELDSNIKQQWNQWLQDLKDIQHVQVKRHVKPDDFGTINNTEVHHFADASQTGYGACSYLRLVNTNGAVHCALILAKARVAPLNPPSIPRLELQGAVTATLLAKKLKEELNIKVDREFFWTDSTVVLGYIKNSSAKYLPYVANRVTQIRNKTNVNDWYHISGLENTADIASRGMSISDLMKSRWFHGPQLLWMPNLHELLVNQPKEYKVDEADRELKKVTVNKSDLQVELNPCIENFSCWDTLLQAATRVRIAGQRMGQKIKPYWNVKPLEPEDMDETKFILIKLDQQKYFQEEIRQLEKGQTITKESKIAQLSPFLDSKGIMRVGSRATKSQVLSYQELHPAIIHKESHMVKLLIRKFHNKVYHQGRLYTQAAIRQAGYWLMSAQSLIKGYINCCVICKHLRGKPCTQQMGALPKERVEPAPPFTNIGIDTFGPFHIKEKRTELKRWCILFTCMYSRAVHIEVVYDLSTDSFLQALRCLQSIRGPVSIIFSDAGTNFMGAKPILTNITFKTNTPGASHQGGVWERGIREIRSVFAKMAGKYATRMDTAALRTAMYEVMNCMNSKPLTAKNLDDPSEGIITPNHLLTMKTNQLQPPSGDYSNLHIYANKMAGKVEQFAKEFSRHWRDYLATIEVRQKWRNIVDNAKVGDLVLLVDENAHRNEWKTGTIVAVKADANGLVRSASVKVNNKDGNKPTVLERPIQKLILIMQRD